MFKKSNKSTLPSTQQIEEELKRVKHKRKYNSLLRSTIYLLITIAAISVLIAMLVLPVLQIYGHSMTPSLADGEIVICVKTTKFEQGDIVAFYYNNKILVKRLIANPNSWVDLDTDGNVYINGELIDEPYIEEKALGNCNIELPYQVPEGKYFFMGDHRDVSIDSRNDTIGCISEEQIVGKLVFRIYPFNKFGPL